MKSGPMCRTPRPLQCPATMARVRVEPLGVELEVEPGESLIEAAWRLGYHWPTTCFGQAECMLCRVDVVAGEEQTVPAEAAEETAVRTRLPASARRPGLRLACRLRIRGDGVVVRKAGVVGPSPDAR
ncbi:MAG: ferredoxin [Actinomycetia bacterium]|nr:ferredoxin [Actinomycetes bacterium]